MWIGFAFGSAFFAGITAILAKCGIKKTDSDVATAIRTGVVLVFSWLMVLISGSLKSIAAIGPKTWIFLILSGLATGASWLCYFKALQRGDVNKVVPIDKSSTVLTILLAVIFLEEPMTWLKGCAVVAIAVGTYLMIQKKEKKETVPETSGQNREYEQNSEPEQKDGCEQKSGHSWLLYALLSAIFASLTAILGKVGIEGVESNLGTAIRTCVVLLMAWVLVFVTGKQHMISQSPKKELLFICLSGLATGASWLCYYKALQEGNASVVVPIDKLSILVSIAFSFFVFHERLTKKAALGLVLIVVGTLAMLIPI